MKKTCFIWTFLLTTLAIQAQGPNNSGSYYQNADGKSGATLKTALFGIISKNKKSVGYDGLYDGYKKTDTRPDGYVRDWYSNTTNYKHGVNNKGSYQKEGDMYNREHSVPQSWGSPKADIVHVLPTDGYVNNRRGNYPLAEVGKVTYQSNNGYSKLGSCKTAGYSGTVFEPNDEIKGDMARIYFYMVTCYEDQATGWGNSVFSSSKYPGFEDWYLEMLMRWSKQDPVDSIETARNNAVYEVQNNRNPFVDYPGLEDYVWGSKKEEPFSYDNYQGGGSNPDITIVSAPMFSPGGGSYTDSVVVTITTSTDSATIYYTTNNANASTQSKVYTAPIKLTETTTLKAIAVKNGTSSYQTIATYTITNSQGGEQPVEGMIVLNNQFFNVNYSGSVPKSDSQDFVGTQNGITVVYSLGTNGENRYCNDSQIRLYKYNQLSFSTANDSFTELEFQLAKETSKKLQASTGTISDLTWTGNARQVVFSVDDGSGNMQLSGVKVKLASATDIQNIRATTSVSAPLYNLSGQRVKGLQMRPGIYILNGKKIVIR